MLKLLKFAWQNRKIVQAFIALGEKLREVVDPSSPGGRWIDLSERPGVNQAWWTAYDKATDRNDGEHGHGGA